jgi:hypothetical protein
MVQSRDLTARFEAYGDWRRRLASAISGLHDWLGQEDLADAQIDAKLQRLQESLPQDKLVVAFVAEFSRGKSELINAIFFADFGKRLLPSSAGRTTMCPTELFYDPSWPTSIRLLPIETRAKGATVAEFRSYADEWVSLPLDLSSADQMSDALSRVSQVKRVPEALAAKYGLYCERDGRDASSTSDDGSVEIPRWRHALINFPHPLLQRGLVIMDTPGLNAIGTEPELTLHFASGCARRGIHSRRRYGRDEYRPSGMDAARRRRGSRGHREPHRGPQQDRRAVGRTEKRR